MNKCILTKYKSAVSADLPIFNVFRFTVKSSGDKSGRIQFGRLFNPESYSAPVVLKITQGNGYFTNSGGTANYGDSVLLTSTVPVCYPVVSSDTMEISVMNFDQACDCLGYADNAICTDYVPENYPYVYFDFKEVGAKESLVKSIVIDDKSIAFYTSSLKDLAPCSEITNITFKRTNGITGSLGDLKGCTRLSTFIDGKNQADCSTQVTCSLDDIIELPSLENVEIYGGHFLGGDAYSLLMSKSELSLYISRSQTKTEPTCSYVSGSSIIPTVAITKFIVYDSGKFDKANTIALLNLFKDGINANKITITEDLIITSSAPSDSDIVSLKNDLINLGVNITITG